MVFSGSVSQLLLPQFLDWEISGVSLRAALLAGDCECLVSSFQRLENLARLFLQNGLPLRQVGLPF